MLRAGSCELLASTIHHNITFCKSSPEPEILLTDNQLSVGDTLSVYGMLRSAHQIQVIRATSGSTFHFSNAHCGNVKVGELPDDRLKLFT